MKMHPCRHLQKRILLLAFVLLGVFICKSQGMKQVTDIIDSMFKDKDKNPDDYYDKRIRPDFGTGRPVKVSLTAYILDLHSIDEKNHEFTVQLYLREKWIDGRLAYRPPPGIEYVQLDPDNAKKLWIPDVFIINERKALKHEMTVANEFTRVSPNGEVLRSIRISVTASCKMNLKWFPFDRHICSLDMESYGYTANEYYFEWILDDKGQPKISISEGASGTINQEIRSIRGDIKNVAFASGNFTRAAIDFLVVRVSTRFIQDVYFPAIVLVTIAFITMSVGALQFRVMLSVLCMVAIILFTSLLSQEMPKVSYQTALDFFVFKCSFMIFNVVIVNFIMYHLLKPKPTSVNTRMRLRQINGSTETDEANGILPDAEASEEFNMGRPTFDSRIKGLLYKCCMYSQYTMPTFFLIFNIIYWPVVLFASNSVGTDDNFMILEKIV